AQLIVGMSTDQNGRETPSGTGGISETPLFNNLPDPREIIVLMLCREQKVSRSRRDRLLITRKNIYWARRRCCRPTHSSLIPPGHLLTGWLANRLRSFLARAVQRAKFGCLTRIVCPLNWPVPNPVAWKY